LILKAALTADTPGCIAMITDMGLSGTALYQLMTWLSPSYPVGSYTYSHGLEYAVETGWVKDANDTREWIACLCTDGDGMVDAALLAHAYRAVDDAAAIFELLEFANAFIPSAELALESTMQGAAFLEITEKAWPIEVLSRLRGLSKGPYPYPVVIGLGAAAQNIPLEAVLHAYLHGFAANMASAAMRLIPLGQTDGQLITAALAEVIPAVVSRAMTVNLEDLSTNTLMADIGSMNHETQYTRLFRS